MNIALVFAGGYGIRMHSKGVPKQFLEINGKPIIIRTLEHFSRHPEISAICVVCIEDWIPYLQKQINRFDIEKVIGIVPGGCNGQASIYNGLQYIKDYADTTNDSIVLIHDGVRPLINAQVISDNIESVKKFGSSVTSAPAQETIIQVDGEMKINATLDRSACRIARAPQSFYLDEIIEAHNKAIQEGIQSNMVDSASLMFYYGKELATVEGPVENIKVTTPMDFYLCRAYFQQQEDSQIWGI